MAGISSKAAGGKENKFKFGEKELQSKEFSDGTGLELYDFGARNLDPQIGRWHSADPLADNAYSLTPYRYSFNNPILFVDPDGRWEFKVGERNKKDKDGNETSEKEKYLKLVKDEKDNLNTLSEQTGIQLEDLKALGIDFDKMATGAALLGLGDLIKFDVINEALNFNATDCIDKNNCWNMSDEYASGKRISKDGNFDDGKNGYSVPADIGLGMRYKSVEKPKSGNTIRFAKASDNNQDGVINEKDSPPDKVGGITHSAIFLLTNSTGTQVFTKNGSAASKYEIIYTNKPVASLDNSTMLQSYGNPTGLRGSTPFFEKK